ncbi:ATP synthase F1 subunit gamma [Candidatus Uhrbacteria bacterium]|nr:ATP synthase F1 subunit gamma [Candidatus Uhrbacteria bacterium]
MAQGTLAIRRQIKSIRNTKKVTKAMEMVSAAKMRKAIAAVQATRPYATGAWDLLRHLSPHADKKLHPLLQERPVKRVGIVVVSTNRGLCGGFNTTLAHHVVRLVEKEKKNSDVSVELMTIGKRSRDTLARLGYTVAADFIKKDMTVSVWDILPLVHLIVEKYEKQEYDRVYLVYTDFISSVKQKALTKQLLPFGLFESDASQEEGVDAVKDAFAEFLFEPGESEVLDYVIPRLLESQVFQAILESEASEHSSRMMAMHNATEAASDFLADLSLAYNQIRQAGITQEIAEISSGRAAME